MSNPNGLVNHRAILEHAEHLNEAWPKIFSNLDYQILLGSLSSADAGSCISYGNCWKSGGVCEKSPMSVKFSSRKEKIFITSFIEGRKMSVAKQVGG